MEKRWRIRPHDSAAIARLERSAGVSSVVAQLLVARGVTDPSSIQDFLAAKLGGLRDPEQLPGLAEAADRIYAAIREDIMSRQSMVSTMISGTRTFKDDKAD